MLQCIENYQQAIHIYSNHTLATLVFQVQLKLLNMENLTNGTYIRDLFILHVYYSWAQCTGGGCCHLLVAETWSTATKRHTPFQPNLTLPALADSSSRNWCKELGRWRWVVKNALKSVRISTLSIQIFNYLFYTHQSLRDWIDWPMIAISTKLGRGEKWRRGRRLNFSFCFDPFDFLQNPQSHSRLSSRDWRIWESRTKAVE